MPSVVLKACRHDKRIGGDREVVVLGDGLGRVVQKEGEGDWGDRDEISRTGLAQVLVQSLLYDCVIKNRGCEEQREITLQNLEVSVISLPGPPASP